VNRLLGPALSWIVAVWTLPFPICLAAAQWGGVDTTFTLGSGRNAGFDADTVCVAVQSDGKIVVGGIFAHYQGAILNGIARLNSDGTLDATFDPGTGANNTVEALGAQPDGKVIIAGRFTAVNGASHIAVARLNPGGSPDSTFSPSFIGLENIVDTLALQADGRMLIGGAFTLANTPAPA